MKNHKITTETEQTATGEVEYDAIECDECEYTVPLDSVVTCLFPESFEEKSSMNHPYRYMVEGSDGNGTLRVYCQDCAEHKFDDGVLEQPVHKKFLEFVFDNESSDWFVITMVVFTCYFVISGLIVATLIIV